MTLFIKRPVMTTLLMTGILFFGLLAYRELPVSDLPAVDFPTISVQASLPGANAETMASAVATPLEKQFSTISGLDSMTSASGPGSTTVTLQFSLDRDIDAAAQDVQSAIAAVQRQLPRDMPSPPSYQKVNPTDQPVLFIALTSPTLPLSRLTQLGSSVIAQRVSTISGVAQVQVYGSQKSAVRIQLDPAALAARGIGLNQVATAVQQHNVNLPTGVMAGKRQALTVRADGQLDDAAEFRDITVAYRNGAPVRLGDLGRVTQSVENNKVAAWFKDNRTVMMAVQRQPGANTVKVVESVRNLLPLFTEQLPAAARMEVFYDRSIPIRESVHDVKFTLVLALGLVILVIFLFLRNLTATFIPAMALPMSVIGTFPVLHLLGFSLDNLSLMALTLAVGFVVDDAIVMLENIVRHLEMGKPAFQAAVDGSKEVSFTIVSMTVSLIAVFIPLLFMGGIVGRLFHEFAVTISAAILVSGIVSLTLTPMLASKLLRDRRAAVHGGAYMAIESIYNGTLRLYERSLAWVMRRRAWALWFSLLVLFVTIWLFKAMPKGFLPSDDTGFLRGSFEAAEGVSFDSMLEYRKSVAAILAAEPSVDAWMISVGAGGLGSANQGRFFIRLKPRGERKADADGAAQALRGKLSSVAGIKAFVLNPPPINIGGRLATSLYQYTLQSPDFDQLKTLAPKLEAAMRQMPELQDVNSDLRVTNPELKVNIARDRAAALGITPQQIEEALYTAFGPRQVSTILASDDQYQVIMELLPEYQDDASTLGLIHVAGRSGELVPLDAVATIARGVGPMSVNHSGQLPSVTISFNLKPGVALSHALDSVNRAATEILPDTVLTGFSGTAQAFQASQTGMLVLLVVAIMAVYLVLGILYESFIHPITILTGLPFAALGALLTLLAFRLELGLYAFVGIIMLLGVVKKNAIMMVDFALAAQRRDGKPAAEAILTACSIRFRPIMMTTMAALFATLPIAAGFGAGAAARRPLGLAVVGGLLISQLITLYITPVFYTYLDELPGRIRRIFSGKRSLV